MISSIIPENIEGKQNDIVFSRTLDSLEQAAICFRRAIKRLLNPSIWHDLTGSLSATVKLFTNEGEAHRLAELNDFYRIDIPGPGTRLGAGFDWVQVTAIEDRTSEEAEEELYAMRLQPSSGPHNDNNNNAAHFFKANASSNFVIHREGEKVTASYHGRNEVPNNQTNDKLDNIRNSIISAGAALGLSEAQWSSFIEGLLQDEIGA